LTETCAVSCISDRYDSSFGHVGSPTACIEIKLVDIPEMDYMTTDKPNPRGEIWLRGPSVFAGYYKNATVTYENILKI
jgi:long-chain acyl-CoA synthetase